MDFYTIFVYIIAFIGLFVASFYVINLFYHKKQERNPNEKQLKVSIIIPAVNEEKTIVNTIKSALSIDYPKNLFEVIVVDDGSNDKTYALAKKFASSINPKVKVLTKSHGGKGSALNLGIKHASGEIIITMDADTFVSPDSVRKMMSYFYSKDVMSVTPSMGVHRPETIWQRVQHIEYYLGVFLRKSFSTLNAIHVTPGAFSAYRKEFFEKYGGYDEHNITEDLEIALRIQSKGFIIENAAEAAIYTRSPRSFKTLLVQRRRWYAGLARNLWNYRHLFGFKRGPLGYLVLPLAVLAIFSSMFLTTYTLFRTMDNLHHELNSLMTINFQFYNNFELNSFIVQRFILNLFSQPVFVLTFLLLIVLGLYLAFARRKMKFTESLKWSYIIFIVFYSILFTIWWLVSWTYIIFNKKVAWREHAKE
jgi:cellulose synthase/poly-beta-1,6-N-acetylglucosamine synthase-like glycosyltransferase